LYEFANGPAGNPWFNGQPASGSTPAIPAGALNSPGSQVFIQYDGTGQIGTLVPQSIFPTPTAGNPFGFPTAPAGWFALNRTQAVPASVINYGGDLYLNQSLIPEIDRYSFFAQGAYDITPNVEAYAEVLLNRRESRSVGFRQFWTYLYSYDLGDSTLDPAWGGTAIYSPTPVTDHNDAEQVVDYMRVISGLRGEFGGFNNLGSIGWDVTAQFSRSDGDYTQDVILQDAVYSADGRSDFGTVGLFNANSIPRATASCVGFTTPISNRPCVDVDWMSPGLMDGSNISAADRAFLFDTETGNTVYEQWYIEGIITGDIFTLPAGNVGAVLGAVYREDEINDVPGRVTRAGNSWGLSSAGITAGSDTTQEVFAEVEIPILAGLPLAERVTLNLSGRYTDVDSSGEADTHKIGLSWQFTPAWQLRYSQGTSFRAPALFELYLADESSFASQRAVDPCIQWQTNLDAGTLPQRIADNCAADGIPGTYDGAGASATAFRGGGLGLLEPETSDAMTVGLVFTPSFADLSIAVDYVEIEVNDQVATLGAANIVVGCYNSETFPTDPLCSLFTRGGGGTGLLITEIRNSFLNINSQENRAIDLTTRYDHEFAWGDFSIQGQFTWQLEDVISLFAGNPIDTNGDVGEPDWVGNIDLRVDRGDWTYFWGIDMIGKASEAEDIGDRNAAGTTLYKVHTEFTAYHDVSVRYTGDQWTIAGGISNLFDEQPPTLTRGGITGQYATQGLAVLASQYDYVGRGAFVRLTRAW
jgi:iron complex outermembrane receptor protein